MNKISTKMICLCGLFAALTAICSQIAFDIGPVPISFATFSVFVAAGMLGAKFGTISQLVYVLIGAVGVPVFAHFTGGFSIVTGPTGGYIVGYVVAAFITGLIVQKVKINKFVVLPIAMLIGLIACYALGTVWFMHVTNRKLWDSLGLCVFPFIPGDIIKITFATILVARLKKVIKI